MKTYSLYKLYLVGTFLTLNFTVFAQNLPVESFEKKLLETPNALTAGFLSNATNYVVSFVVYEVNHLASLRRNL